MGCSSSKLDDLPAVALCRDRCAFLDEAIRERYALSQAHSAYLASLQQVGRSLRDFLDNDFAAGGRGGGGGSPSSPLSPKLTLPPQKKGDPRDSHVSASPPHRLSGSDSGSHLHFQSDSDDEDDDGDSHSLHNSDHSSPLHAHAGHISYMGSDQEVPAGYMHMNYMKNKATPSVVYEQRPLSPETLHVGESSSSSSFYPYPYPTNNSASYPYSGYPNYGGPTTGYHGSPSRFGPSSPPPPATSSSKPPPPPPPPPRASAWDFLYPFDTYDNYYPTYTPSRDSRELREEEGIPDLEDEDSQHEVLKEVHGDQKFVDGGAGGGGPSYSKAAVEDGGGKDEDSDALLYRGRPNTAVENDGVEYEVHVVDKKVVNEEGKSEDGSGATEYKGPRDVSDVAREIEVQFVRASEAGAEISNMLEVGRLPYNRKNVPSKMLHLVTPSLSVVASQPSTSKSAEPSSSADKGGPAYSEVDEDLALRAKNLSATLQKLHLWEKKLYNEVKAEEKMRVVHDKKRQKLKHLDERGAEPHKLDSTRTIIRSLSTKIRIAIQVVDKISVTINKIRDEELWPQLNELIKGLTRMYKCMFECHHVQCQAIREVKIISPIVSGKKPNDEQMEAMLQLEHDLMNWTYRFSSWVSAQKGYVRALNNWLLKCLLYEPEETPDGVAPFSPGRMGAPPVFVICNQWSESLKRISEAEVIDSMRIFSMVVSNEQDKVEMRQRMMTNKDLERKVRLLERDKKVITASRDSYSLSVPVYQSDTSKNSMHASLQHIFEAMEKFSAESTKAYEELLQRSEEETRLGSRES